MEKSEKSQLKVALPQVPSFSQTGGLSSSYIQLWNGDKQRLTESLHFVQQTASFQGNSNLRVSVNGCSTGDTLKRYSLSLSVERNQPGNSEH